ncbi:MAG: hypothetical protein JWM80_4850 [Cyanobacteria bacterium RYN_339]|nr:hypothetical protein [Cyanobacteria bacterium RYN_339]
MPIRTAAGLALLALALVAGLVGDGLLRALPWGLNLGLWAGLLFLGILVIRRRLDVGPGAGRLAALSAALVFALLVAWRASPTLALLDVGIMAVLGAAAAIQPAAKALRLATVLDHLVGLVMATIYAAFGLVALVTVDIDWKAVPRDGWLRHLLAFARGLAIAVPLLIVFGALFMAADAVFQGLVTKAFNITPEEIVGHALLFGALTWVLGGYLRGLGFGDEMATIQAVVDGSDANPPKRRPGLGVVEIAVVLGLLDVLFAAFVAVQFRYFFGGASLVEATKSLTYADYARHGFFELCTVAALCLPMLLVGHWLFRPEKPAHHKVFNALALVLVGLLAVITVSGLMRMRLYTHEYGLTELRLYTSVFMGWLALIQVWFCVTVLPGRGDRFAFGALVAGLVAAGLLHVANPDALIVRYNLVHGRTHHGADLDYVLGLSADAVPALLENWADVPEPARGRVAQHLWINYHAKDAPDWRTWNWSRSQARAAVQAQAAMLQPLAQSFSIPPKVER